MTLDRDAVTGQQSFDSYIGELTSLTLDLINEIATPHAHGVLVSMTPAEDRRAINAVFAADNARKNVRAWLALDAEQAKEFAAAVRRMRIAIDAALDGDMHHAAEVLNALLAEHHAVPNLHGGPGEVPTLAFHAANTGRVAARVAEMSTAIAMIIGTGRLSRLGRCGAAGCDRAFYDVTRNGSRRFCGLACQNRAKASAFRARWAAR